MKEMKRKAIHVLGLSQQPENTTLKVKRPRGGEALGTLYKGSTTNAFSRHSCGSIPAPSEPTLVARPDLQTYAFGSACNRFVSPSPNTSNMPVTAPAIAHTPGPGSYHKSNDATSTLRTDSESFSRLGYGVGFASKSHRFTAGGLNHRRNFPGPGSYAASALHTS